MSSGWPSWLTFDFEVKHRSRRENTNADALSRFPPALRCQKRTGIGAASVSALAVTAAEPGDAPDDPDEE